MELISWRKVGLHIRIVLLLYQTRLGLLLLYSRASERPSVKVAVAYWQPVTVFCLGISFFLILLLFSLLSFVFLAPQLEQC
jgi:hypothetical protein